MGPDRNPNELLWKELKLSHPSNLREVEQFGQDEWAERPAEKCRSLIKNYKKGLIVVIASEGCAKQ